MFIGKELVGSCDKLWVVCFLPFFHGVHSVLWIARLFLVCSLDLFSMEGLVVRYKPYLRCTRLHGSSWFSLILHGMAVICLLFLFVLGRYKWYVTVLGWVGISTLWLHWVVYFNHFFWILLNLKDNGWILRLILIESGFHFRPKFIGSGNNNIYNKNNNIYNINNNIKLSSYNF